MVIAVVVVVVVAVVPFCLARSLCSTLHNTYNDDSEEFPPPKNNKGRWGQGGKQGNPCEHKKSAIQHSRHPNSCNIGRVRRQIAFVFSL